MARARLERVVQQPHRRRTSDWLRVGAAAVLVFLAARHAGEPTATERAIFDVFNTLPNSLLPVFRGIYRLGALWTVGLGTVAALAVRRWRLAVALLLAGVSAWAFGRLLGELVVEGTSVGQGLRAVTRLGPSPAFPAVRLGVVVAVSRAASPYMPRPARWVGRLVVVGLAMAALYLGSAFPNDVFAGLALGWGVAAAIHLLLGSPGGRPTVEQVERSLLELGVAARDVELDSHQPTGATVMWATSDEGRLRIKVIGRDEADAQFMSKLWRFLVYKDSGPRLAITRVQQVEHEAYVTLLARDHGVSVPRVLAAGSAGPGAALLVEQEAGGTTIAHSDSGTIEREALLDAWRQLCRLRDARIAHGRPDAEHFSVDGKRVTLVGFEAASSTGVPETLAIDVAQLLATTAVIAGDDEAIRLARSTVGDDALADALPWLQPPVMTRVTRTMLGPRRSTAARRLAELRDRSSRMIGVEAPEPVQLGRVRRSSVALAIGAIVAVGALLSEIGDPSDLVQVFRHADPGWIVVALALSFAANIGYAIGLQGTVRRPLPLWPTTELQLGMSFSNLAIPGIGGTGMQVRFLQRQGVDLSSAVAAGGLLSTIGNLAAALLLFAVALAVEPAQIDLSLLPTSGLAEVVGGTAAALVVVAVLVSVVPWLRRTALPPLRRAVATIAAAARSPRQLGLLIGGNLLAALLSTWCLVACLAAFGGQASFWALLAANVGVVTVASIVPIPGGGNAVGTVGLSAALVAFGVTREVAVATALANQVAFYYLPAVPGWFATRHLVRAGYL